MTVPPRTAIPSRTTIRAAADLLEGRVRRTPVIEWEVRVGTRTVPVVLKLELLQHTGSFKPRGAFATVLAAPRRPGLLVTASGGNHGLAVAHVGAELGVPAQVFVPESAPAVKVAGIRALGADVVPVGNSYAEAARASRERADEPGVLHVHAYDAPTVLAGQGTVGREFDEQVRDLGSGLDEVLVAVGGGGLIGGIAAWFGTTTGVVAVEPHGAPTLHAALAAGRPVDVAVGGLGADALGAARIGENGFASVRAARIASSSTRTDRACAARRLLWNDLRVAAEPGGATALAGLLSGAHVPADGARVGVVVCGGNADPADLGVL